MTNEQCIGQIKQMMGSWEKGGLSYLHKECERLIGSGAVDLSEEEEEGSFYMAKIILHVALENLSGQFRPISRTGEEIADNLRLF